MTMGGVVVRKKLCHRTQKSIVSFQLNLIDMVLKKGYAQQNYWRDEVGLNCPKPLSRGP